MLLHLIYIYSEVHGLPHSICHTHNIWTRELDKAKSGPLIYAFYISLYNSRRLSEEKKQGIIFLENRNNCEIGTISFKISNILFLNHYGVPC